MASGCCPNRGRTLPPSSYQLHPSKGLLRGKGPRAQHTLLSQGQWAHRRNCFGGARSRRLATLVSMSPTFLPPGLMGWLCVPW